MDRRNIGATWPLLCVLVGMFILGVVSPRAWQSAIRPDPVGDASWRYDIGRSSKPHTDDVPQSDREPAPRPVPVSVARVERIDGFQSVQPSAKLASRPVEMELPRERLRDQVRRIPFPPIIRIRPVLKRAETDDARVKPGTTHIAGAVCLRATPRARDDNPINPRLVGRVPLKLLPPGDSPRPQFLLVADYVKVTALLTHPDRQRQPPESLLADHPVVHVLQPV